MIIIKSKIIVIIISVLVILGLSSKTNAIETTTYLTIENSIVEQGGEISVPINIKDIPVDGINSFNLGIKYDSENLRLLSIEKGKIIKSQEDFIYNEVANGTIFCLFNDATQGERAISENGELMYLNFIANDNSKVGDLKIEFYEDDKRKIDIATVTPNRMNLVRNNGNVNIVLAEDVDSNGIVDIEDLSKVAFLYNVTNENNLYIRRNDINKDNVIDIFDISRIAKKL